MAGGAAPGGRALHLRAALGLIPVAAAWTSRPRSGGSGRDAEPGAPGRLSSRWPLTSGVCGEGSALLSTCVRMSVVLPQWTLPAPAKSSSVVRIRVQVDGV